MASSDERNIDKDQERNKNSNYHKKQVVGEEENRGFIKGHQLRLQHINVLTTILHKCLLAHDVLRASRAWGLLIRMQVSGQGMDLRASGYWSIGAELLIRSLCSKHSGATFNSETETDDGGISGRIRNKSHHPESSRSGWDLKKNLQKTTDYYERLIIEYPFKKQFLSKINALDWWPVMISCEIYGIQHEQKKAIHDLQTNTTLEKELSSQDISCDESDREDEIDYEANIFDNDIKSNNERLVKRKQFRKQEHRWQLENKIRLTALNASEKIAVRLDERMTTPPYSESLDLLHLRGMLALYIGDLHLPPLPPKYQMEELGIKNDDQFPKSRNIGNGSISQGRLLFRERNIEFQNGLARRSQEINNAKTFFEKLVKLGGDEAAIINLGGENLRIDDEFLPSDILSDD
ncbi:hypothetical protein HI914_02573 [Erysiphe necator]|nr:hypothetical protein HI914_02573 [Erysiphe necator]